MVFVAVGLKEAPLLTVGDAVASFIARPDPKTRDTCLLSQTEVSKSGGDVEAYRRPRAFQARSVGWFSAGGKSRWISCIILYFILLAVVLALLIYGIQTVSLTGSQASLLSLWASGLGVDPTTFISWSIPSDGAAGLIANVVVANIPQLLLSVLYFFFNGLITSFALSWEWSAFSKKRKGLRVSEATQGEQRSKYFLQLPYQIAVPLLVLSGIMHWLISQSFFVVDIEQWSYDYEEQNFESVYGYGQFMARYSPAAMIAVLVVGGVVVASLVVFGFRRAPQSGIPLVGSCSLAISASCHADASYEKAGDYGGLEKRRLKWGITGEKRDGIEHCGFSDLDVYPPVEGGLYA